MVDTLERASAPLQPVLRLIHCVQKERGASCALVGSLAGSGEGHPYESKLRACRIASNSAIAAFYGSAMWRRFCAENGEGDRLEIASMLFNARQLVDEGVGDENEYLFFHDVFVEYNNLLSDCLIQVFVVNELSRKKEAVQKSVNSTTMSHESRRNAQVALSLLDLIVSFVTMKESLGRERATLSGLMANGMNDQSVNVGMEEMHNSNHGDRLHLIVNDLVMVVEDQHRIMRDLRKKSGLDIRLSSESVSEGSSFASHREDNDLLLLDENYSTLIGLVGESIVPNDAMRSLQNYIRKDFDIERFQHATTMEKFWVGITLYMDQLHSMELFLLEELKNREGSFEDLDLLSLERGGNQASPQVTVDAVSKMTEEELRQALVSLLTQKESKLPAPASSSKSHAKKKKTHSRNTSLSSFAWSIDGSGDRPSLEEWEISLYDVEFHKRIGRGSAGTTYLGRYCQQDVAIKVAATSEMGLEGWKAELKSLRKMHHVNIIRCLGAIQQQSPLTYCLVLEYCNGGDLSECLSGLTPPKFFTTVASGVAYGMSYLHKQGFMHRDIKPSNVLISGDPSGVFVAKLTDFGLAAKVHNPSVTNGEKELTAETGTYRYMAPEVIRHERYNCAADVYSFGLLMWEMITREKPFADKSQIEAAGAVALEGKRPPFPAGIPPDVRTLIEQCWAGNPSERMEVGKIIQRLDELGSNPYVESWLSSPVGHRVYKHIDDDQPVEDVPRIDIKKFQEKRRKSILSGLFSKRK